MCAVILMRNVELTLAKTWPAVSLNRDTWRIIPSHYPPIQLFEKCADPEDLEALYVLEGLTNDRVQTEIGDLSLISKEDRVSGPGSSVIMAAFTHIGTQSRFTDGSYGVYYAGLDLTTAIRETSFWQAKQMADSNEPPFERVMRVYQARIDPARELLDVRASKQVHKPNSFAAAQKLGKRLRAQGHNGVYYNSVRHPGGECVGVFKPNVLKRARQGKHLRYCWDGEKIYHIDEIKELRLS